MRGFTAVFRKELLQMVRDKGTLRFALLVPIFQLVLFGLIDTNIRRVPTVVFDQSNTKDSRALLDDLENTSVFAMAGYAPSREALREEIVAGHAQIGVEIPPDFARKRLRGETAEFLVLIDGSDNTVSSQALGAANGVALSRSLAALMQQRAGGPQPLEAKTKLLFNPSSRSAELLIPGLVAILLTFSGMLLAVFSIVRERERGTLEQLMVSPVSPLGVIIGKLLPYLMLGFLQLIMVLALMTYAFGVPIHGNLLLLLGLALIYLFALLIQGLMISSKARTQAEAIQLAQMFLLPSIMLSGYIFPLRSLPVWLQWIAQILPATHFIAISRGIIIRGARFMDLWEHVAALLLIAAVLLAGSARAFKKTVS